MWKISKIGGYTTLYKAIEPGDIVHVGYILKNNKLLKFYIILNRIYHFNMIINDSYKFFIIET